MEEIETYFGKLENFPTLVSFKKQYVIQVYHRKTAGPINFETLKPDFGIAVQVRLSFYYKERFLSNLFRIYKNE